MFEYKITHEELFPDRKIAPPESYQVRNAVRAILTDAGGNLALTMINKSGFYYLPGGGVEDGENYEEALHRECLEEAGCSIEQLQSLGTVSAYCAEDGMQKIAHCFSARVSEKNTPTEPGAEVIFVSREKALEILKTQFEKITPETPNFYARKFNTKRDLLILESLL